jgi:F-type H+-transporting ATPase subunit b
MATTSYVVLAANEAPVQAGVQAPASGEPRGSDFPPFDSANFAPQLIWLALTFGALYLLMSRIALPRVEGILKDRQAHISSDIAAAIEMQKQADAAGTVYEKTLAEAKARAQATAQETHARLAAESQAKRKLIENDLSAKLAAAEAEITATKAQAMSNVEAIAREAATAIVKHITGWGADAEEIAKAVAAARLG